jgi:hypothetical protein
MYLTTESDLREAIETAFVHCRPSGAALFAPDCVRETFRPYTDHGGHDVDNRGMRYLEWTWDPDPSDSTYVCDFAYMLREGGGVRVEHDQHVFGLFARQQWLDLIKEVGFEPRCVPFIHSEIEGEGEVFIGVRR